MPVQYNIHVLLDYYHHSPGACESSFENYQNLEQSGIDSFAKIDSEYTLWTSLIPHI
jgi:hypothetical protein